MPKVPDISLQRLEMSLPSDDWLRSDDFRNPGAFKLPDEDVIAAGPFEISDNEIVEFPVHSS